MIKNNPIGVVSVTMLFLAALLSCWLSVRWFFSMKEFQALEYQYQYMNNTSAAIQALANDAIEYSRRNPAIDPVLQQFNLKALPATAPAVSPQAAPKSTR